MQRRRKIGAEVTARGVEFRVWAPAHERVAVVIDGRDVPLDAEEGGYFCGLVSEARAGTLYRFRLDGKGDAYPDPASRFQPQGPHGPSEVIDPRFAWTDGAWKGLTTKDRVLYELHIGTFTREGTYAAVIEHLPYLAEVGINVIELMPVNEWAGRFGWGYDGVDLWAPTNLYGRPDDLRRFIDAAHAHGIGVLLDVVYNHLGPDGCYLTKFTPSYFTKKYENEWGEAVNFDGDDAHGVREFFLENAAYWIDEFHFDGMRIDATQSMFDDSGHHILRELSEAVRGAARDRGVLLVAENEPQDRVILTEHRLDAMWNDDWHHAARVAATGRREAYYTDYRGAAQEFVSMARGGFLYQGQRYAWQKKRRGTPSQDIAPERLVCYLQNHDQVANSGSGARIHQLTSPGRYRALTALLLLQPQTPMLFQGQEFAAPSPFVYFADHDEELAVKVSKGRREFVEQFPSLKGFPLAEPHERATFDRCKLDHTARDPRALALHRDLLRLRREQPFHIPVDGAVLGESCLALRWGNERLLIINLGADLILKPAPEPLLAPAPDSARWMILWSSEWPDYGGSGMAEPESAEGEWRITAQSAVLLCPGA